MQRKTRVNTQNGARNEYKHAKRCKGKGKQEQACKTMQMEAKQDAGTQNNVNASKTGASMQNNANASKTGCGHAKQCKCKQNSANVKLIRSYACKNARK